MKTIKNLLFVAFAAISITACQKELADSNASNESQNRGPVVTWTTEGRWFESSRPDHMTGIRTVRTLTGAGGSLMRSHAHDSRKHLEPAPVLHSAEALVTAA